MSEEITLAEGYKLAKCCNPKPDQEIRGYYSYNNEMIIHINDCPNLAKVEPKRLISLNWPQVLGKSDEQPGDDFNDLDNLDFRVLSHHNKYGCDYSLKMARMLNQPKQTIFEKHKKLREMKLLSRVKKLIIQYRKGIVDNKWIKHRNHTYYELTDKGKLYLEYYLKHKS